LLRHLAKTGKDDGDGEDWIASLRLAKTGKDDGDGEDWIASSPREDGEGRRGRGRLDCFVTSQ